MIDAALIADEDVGGLTRALAFPKLRYMGSKARLLPWISEALTQLPSFETALDAFSGSGCVAYLLKSMGASVLANDFLLFPSTIAKATVENSTTTLSESDVEALTKPAPDRMRFVEQTYAGIFFEVDDLVFLDTVWHNLRSVRSPHKKALVVSALVRSCVKRQPRGVFTIGGDLERYKDGRRDLKLSIAEHFVEQVEVYNATVFDNGRANVATRSSVFDSNVSAFDLVYLDPPYVPRADDNCYVKRYHFLEGLASYWTDDDTQPQSTSKVRKIPKRFTPFSYRRTAPDAFDQMFKLFAESTIVLSYSSNGYPDLDVLLDLMHRYKPDVQVLDREHRYHFGTHARVSANRASVREYLIIGEG